MTSKSLSNSSKVTKSLKNILLEKNNTTDIGIVIKIAGKWGTGKTYFWHDFKDKYLKKQDVVYISLFGLNSIEDIKESIVTQLVNYDRNKFKELIKIIKNIKIYNIGIGGIFSYFLNADFEKIIICFDDFERISNKLGLKDVLGLISQLKEQKKCKIIMILNEEELNKLEIIEEEKKYGEIFSLYEEKIVDYHFPFIPSFNEQFKIIENDIDTNLPSEWKQIICNFFKNYNVSNIREMKKSIRNLKHFTFIDNFRLGNETISVYKTGYSHHKHKKLEGQKLNTKVIEEFIAIALSISLNIDISKTNFSQNFNDIKTILNKFQETYYLDEPSKINLTQLLSENHIKLYRYQIREQFIQLINEIKYNFNINNEESLKKLILLIEKNRDEIDKILYCPFFINIAKTIKTFLPHNLSTDDEKYIIQQYLNTMHEKRIDFDPGDWKILEIIEKEYAWAKEYWEKLANDYNFSDTDIISILQTNCYEWEEEFVKYYLKINEISIEKFKELILTSQEFAVAYIAFKTRKYIHEQQCEPPDLNIAIQKIESALDSLSKENKFYKWKVENIKNEIINLDKEQA